MRGGLSAYAIGDADVQDIPYISLQEHIAEREKDRQAMREALNALGRLDMDDVGRAGAAYHILSERLEEER